MLVPQSQKVAIPLGDPQHRALPVRRLGGGSSWQWVRSWAWLGSIPGLWRENAATTRPCGGNIRPGITSCGCDLAPLVRNNNLELWMPQNPQTRGQDRPICGFQIASASSLPSTRGRPRHQQLAVKAAPGIFAYQLAKPGVPPRDRCVVQGRSHGARRQGEPSELSGGCDDRRRSNIGAGTITCNYDGVNKHRTVIGAGSFIGSDTALVPIRIFLYKFIHC